MPWYYSIEGGRQGPVTDSEFESLARAGSIPPTALVWQEGMADWRPRALARPDLLAPVAETVTVAGAPIEAARKDLVVQRMREGYSPQAAVGQLQYGGFWIRFAAKFIDGIVLNVVLLPLNLLTQAPMMALDKQSPEEVATAAPAALALFGVYMLVAMALPVLYHGFMVGKWGASLGKMACGLKVLTPDGQAVTMGRAFGRAAAEIVSGLTCSIGYIIAAFDDEKRTLHDHMATTRVVKSR